VAWWERAEREQCVVPEDPKQPHERTAWIDEIVERTWEERTVRSRRLVRLVRREADWHGQLLLTPEIETEGWWPSVDLARAGGSHSVERPGYKRAVPRRVQDRLEPGAVAVGEVSDQRAGSLAGGGCLQPSATAGAEGALGSGGAGSAPGPTPADPHVDAGVDMPRRARCEVGGAGGCDLEPTARRLRPLPWHTSGRPRADPGGHARRIRGEKGAEGAHTALRAGLSHSYTRICCPMKP